MRRETASGNFPELLPISKYPPLCLLLLMSVLGYRDKYSELDRSVKRKMDECVKTGYFLKTFAKKASTRAAVSWNQGWKSQKGWGVSGI